MTRAHPPAIAHSAQAMGLLTKDWELATNGDLETQGPRRRWFMCSSANQKYRRPHPTLDSERRPGRRRLLRRRRPGPDAFPDVGHTSSARGVGFAGLRFAQIHLGRKNPTKGGPVAAGNECSDAVFQLCEINSD